MAPLSLGDKLNLYSMIGTWLGTLFTLVGLVAVVAHLRSLLKDFSSSRDEIVKAAAGDWAICIPRLRRLDTGVVPGKVPSLRAWIHYHYNEEKSIVVCPYERKSMSGQSSWSQLFCRLQILPEDLLNPGCRSTNDSGRVVLYPQVPTTADLHVDGSKISYGLPGEDFAALLILGSFSPSSIQPKETTRSTSHLGHMYLAPHSDPFTQIAQLDGASWNTFNTFPGVKWEGRYGDRLNVRHCLDLALGILRFQCAGKPGTLLFCNKRARPEYPILQSPNQPWNRPSLQQALNIRRNLTELTGGSIDQNPIYDITSIAQPNFRQIFGRRGFDLDRYYFDHILTDSRINIVLEIAFGLSALKPWGLMPVIPRSLVDAFCPLLRAIQVSLNESPSPILTLTRKFRELPLTALHNIPHRTRATMDSALDCLSQVETRSFSGLSARCSLYYDAMIVVLEGHNLKLANVEIALAARCATQYIMPMGFSQSQHNNHIKELQQVEWEARFRAWVRECLNGEPTDEVEPWACEILATYLHAWLQEAKDIDGDFRENFRRRVFLG